MLDTLRSIVGSGHVLTGSDVQSRHTNWVSHSPCEADAIIRPSTTEELSRIMAECQDKGVEVIVHGGLTGLAGGTYSRPGQIAISLERMNAVGQVNMIDRTVEVGAGATLQNVQETVAKAGGYFALDLGARGSATVGGAISTNAGGHNVLRFGSMREQVLGLEAVLSDGQILSSMHACLKNNTGYDLKHIFIGAEGTLGIVTKAVLRVRTQAMGMQTALLAVSSFDDCIRAFQDMDSALLGKLSAFEVMWPSFYNLATHNLPDSERPLQTGYSLYVLLEARTTGHEREASDFVEALSKLSSDGLIEDAIIAKYGNDRNRLWSIRENLEAISSLPPDGLFDVSFRTSVIPEFLSDLDSRVRSLDQNALLVTFGHLGDNNLHIAIAGSKRGTLNHGTLEALFYETVHRYGGSISAEHGIGTEKKRYLKLTRSASEISVMKTLKRAFDPNNILNPDVLFE